jgi:hypothetical protein
MTTWHWFAELLNSHGKRNWKVNGYGLWLRIGCNIWRKQGPWYITYSGAQPINQL